MRVSTFFFALTFAAFCSCGSDQQLKDGDTVYFPDTMAFKQAWKMNEKVMLTELFAADSVYNQLGLDTFELTYFTCDCPDWIDTSKLDLQCKECSDFYIDPADSSLLLPIDFFAGNNTVRFYGVRVPGMNLPTLNKPEGYPWTVIRYYGYEIVRPYKIWGPPCEVYRITSVNDTFPFPVVVTIR